MANGCNIFLQISVIFQIVSLISAGYLHGQYHGNLINKQLNFSVFITKSPGLILYAIDTNNNKLLITIEKKSDIWMLITKFNSFITSIKIEKLYVCKINENIYIQFVLQLRQEKIVFKCKNYIESLLLEQKDTDQIIGYPLPINFNDYSNTTFIWMGNIGPYIGKNFVQYEPLTHQLNGCLDHFFYNHEFVNMNEKGIDFRKSCNIEYNETKCDQIVCKEMVTVYKVYQCSIEVINGRHCKQDLRKFINQDTPYYLKFDNQNKISIRLEWKEKQSNLYKDFCLLEIEFTDENLALFSINNNGEMKFVIRQNQTGNYYTKFIKQISNKNLNNILLIIFHESELVVKVSNYNEIYSYFIHPIAKPKLVNVGFFRHMSGFSRFDGETKFQIHPNQSRSSNSNNSNNSKTKMSISRKWIIIISCILAIIIICLIIMMIIKLRPIKKTNVDRKPANSSKRSSPNHYEYEMNSSSSKEVGEQEYEAIPNEFEDNPN